MPVQIIRCTDVRLGIYILSRGVQDRFRGNRILPLFSILAKYSQDTIKPFRVYQ